jgi:hypothetical protein
MLVDAKFPVFIEGANVPGYRHPRPVFHVVDTVVEIAEASAADLPVALRSHRTSSNKKRESVQEFRYRDGEFYRPVWEAGEFWLKHMLNTPMVSRGRIGLALRKQVSKATESGHRRRILPEGILEDVLTYASSNGDYEKFFKEKGERVLIPPEAEQSLDEAGEAYHEACQDFLLIDGELWEKCPEPVLSVDVRDRPGRIYCLSTTFLPSENLAGISARPHLGEILFPVLDYDDAKTLSDQSFDRNAPWRSKEFVLDLSMPEAFSTDLPMSEVIGQLDHCHRIHPDKNTRGRLKSFVDDQANWTEGSLQDEVENALDKLPGNQMWRMSALIHQRARFDKKTIHIPMTGQSAPKS